MCGQDWGVEVLPFGAVALLYKRQPMNYRKLQFLAAFLYMFVSHRNLYWLLPGFETALISRGQLQYIESENIYLEFSF